MPSRRTVLKSFAAAVLSSTRGPRAYGEPSEPEALLHDPLRPRFHYLPARNWMNDPCGPIYFQGQYHLFHQYNPHSALWGDMHWAHAVSTDMIHWKRLPVALAPTPGGPDAEGCFTGTAVIDQGRPTLLYTGIQNSTPADATLRDPAHNYRETQCLAIAADDTLGTWRKLPAPVIAAPPRDMQVTGFRDPSPWREGDTWYTIVGSGIAGKGGMVLLYRSADLRSWEYLHPLYEGKWTGIPGSNPVDTGEMWECPEFFALTDATTLTEKHVLIYSTEGKVLWTSGKFDRASLRFIAEKKGELDYGRVGGARVTYYAPKTQIDAQGNRILWGWISETRPDADCVRAGWSGLMSLPRVLTLHDGVLHMAPSAAVGRLRKAAMAGDPLHEFVSMLKPAPPGTRPAAITDQDGTIFELRSNPNQDPNTLDISFGNGVPAITIQLTDHLPEGASLHAFIDNSVFELFIAGRYCLSHRFYSRPAGTTLVTLTTSSSYTLAGTQRYALEAIWPA